MPEFQETFAQHAHCQDFIDKEGPLPVQGFYCDSTKEEDELPGPMTHWELPSATRSALSQTDEPAHNFVRPLRPGSALTRGGHSEDDSRGVIIPPPSFLPFPLRHLYSSRSASNPDFGALVLRRMHQRTRGLLFDFTVLCLAVHLLTHTLVQIYNKEQWVLSICRVSKYKRGFKISFAIDLGNWVLAFTTLDGLTRPKWYKTIPPTTCILADKNAWLRTFVAWLSFVPNWCNTKAALFDFLIGLKDVFNGLGVYTLNDILARAGLSPFWRPVEVFGNPSRTARLVLAYASYVLEAADNARSCLDGCRFGYVIVQDPKRRIRYMRTTFVYGKQEVPLSKTVAEIIEHNEIRSHSLAQTGRFHRGPTNGFLDIWTSDFISTAVTGYFPFQHLVYGSLRWGSKLPPRQSELRDMDPLTAFFASTLTLLGRETTHLHPSAKLPQQGRKKMIAIRAFRLCAGKEGKAICSLYPKLHQSSVSWDPLVYVGKDTHQANLLKRGETRPFTVKVASDEEQITSSPIWIATYTKSYRLGPADYAGAGDLIEQGGAQKRVILCKGDPQANPNDLQMYEHGLLVKAANRATDKSKLRKQILDLLPAGSTEAKTAEQVYKLAMKASEEAATARDASWKLIEAKRKAVAESKPPPPPRQRLSIDARMAQAQSVDLDAKRSSRSQRKR